MPPAPYGRLPGITVNAVSHRIICLGKTAIIIMYCKVNLPTIARQWLPAKNVFHAEVWTWILQKQPMATSRSYRDALKCNFMFWCLVRTGLVGISYLSSFRHWRRQAFHSSNRLICNRLSIMLWCDTQRPHYPVFRMLLCTKVLGGRGTVINEFELYQCDL